MAQDPVAATALAGELAVGLAEVEPRVVMANLMEACCCCCDCVGGRDDQVYFHDVGGQFESCSRKLGRAASVCKSQLGTPTRHDWVTRLTYSRPFGRSSVDVTLFEWH